MRMRHIVVCGLSGSTIFFQKKKKGKFFRRKSYWTQNVCFDFLYNFVLNISHYKKQWARYCIKVHSAACKVPVILVRFE
jgi:hypothetical protein